MGINLKLIKFSFILQSLGILGSIPAAWLIFTLLVLLVYLVTRCCDRKPRHRRSIALLKCSLAIFALFCCGAVAVGLYGNDDVHNGIIQLITAVKHMNDSIMDAVKQVKNNTKKNCLEILFSFFLNYWNSFHSFEEIKFIIYSFN